MSGRFQITFRLQIGLCTLILHPLKGSHFRTAFRTSVFDSHATCCVVSRSVNSYDVVHMPFITVLLSPLYSMHVCKACVLLGV